MPVVEYDLMGNEINKVKTAIRRLQTFCPPEGYYLCFSGGKDSVCIKALADMAGVKYDAHYNVTTVDPPELVRFIAKEFPDVSMDKPKRSMRQLIIDAGMPPTRRMRYCCSELKEAQSVGRIAVTGVRWAESTRRKAKQGLVTLFSSDASEEAEAVGASYRLTDGGGFILTMDNDESRRVVEQCYRTNKTSINPIIDWEDSDVWEFIRTNNLPYCCLYDEGYTRLGCIGCPMGGKQQMKKQFERWPSYYKMYLSAFAWMLETRAKSGKETTWENAQEVMDWWLGETKDKPLHGQMSIEEILPNGMEENGHA